MTTGESSTSKGKGVSSGTPRGPPSSDSGSESQNASNKGTPPSDGNRNTFDPSAYGFSMPDPNFDPLNEGERIREYYRKKAESGPFSGVDDIEDDIEAEAAREVARWEEVKGRMATDEERENMMTRLRRVRGNRWIEHLKRASVGKTEVPIEAFNRLLAENESHIGMFAIQMANFSQERQATYARIRELQDTVERLQGDKGSESDGKSKAELEKMKVENARLQEDLTKAEAEHPNLAQERKETHDKIKLLKLKIKKLQSKQGDEECEKKLAKMEDEVTKLREELAKAKSEPKDVVSLDKFQRVDSELRACHQHRRDREARIELLEQQLKESRGRENGVRDEMKQQDRQIADMQQHIYDLDQQVKEAEGPKEGTPTTEAPGEFDAMKIVRELKALRERNRDLAQDSQALIDRWLENVADRNHLREYYNAIEESNAKTTAFRNRVLALCTKLGLKNGDVFTAEEAIDQAMERIDQMDAGDPLMTVLLSLRDSMNIHNLRMNLATEEMKIETMKLDRLNSLDSEQLQREIDMRYGIYNDEELERRVDARTQMYRHQRRDMLDNIFGAANELNAIATTCPHRETTEGIRTTCKRFLSPLNLPMPTSQAPR
ncbi:hypothetical protein F4804DRAFT_353120 [Jackrogersella minutella]|nr:hypothetical protein F4804DRAFT_353120 [Jackrogersella minutella]